MAMRNANGYGSVYKLSGKRRKPWAVVKTVSLAAGKQERALLGTFATRAEANECLVEYNKNPYDLRTKDMSFLEVFNAYYKYQEQKVTKGTLSNYRVSIKFFKTIYNIPLRELKLYDFQRIFDNSNLAYQSLSVRKVFASSVYEFAIKRELVDKNVATNIEINKKNEAVRIRAIFSAEEIKRLWELFVSVDDNLERQTIACLLVMIYTSLRIGELLELKKENIDFTSEIKTINVVKSKTQAGIRIIPLHDKIIPIIEDLYKNKSVFLINSSRNLSYNYNNWLKFSFRPLLNKLGMEHTPHDCRHTFVTMMTAAGADSVALRQIVGHAGKDVTEKVYTHLPIKVLKANIDLLP